MKTKFTILITLLLISMACGCIQSEISKIEELTPQINDHLKKGDGYYNQSAEDLNAFNENDSVEKSELASSEYNSARSLTSEALSYAQSSQETIYIQYLQLAISEIDAKLNATSELRTAGQLFRIGDNETANTNLDSANNLMQTAKEFEKQREELVKQNPDLFK